MACGTTYDELCINFIFKDIVTVPGDLSLPFLHKENLSLFNTSYAHKDIFNTVTNLDISNSDISKYTLITKKTLRYISYVYLHLTPDISNY